MASISGIHIINKWLWTYLKNTDMFSGDYGGIVPIIPSEQTPELVGIPSGLPFIVYNYKTNTGFNDYWTYTEVAALMIYDYQEPRMRDIRNFIMNITKRLDDTARDINAFNDFNANGIIFNYVKASAAASTAPDQEGGRMGTMITLRYDYTRQIDAPFAFAT